MNVIVSNKYQAMLVNLDLDIIKNLNGEFSVDELVANFANFYYNKMILDITALKDYKDLNTFKKLSVDLDMSKVILLLDDSEEVNGPGFISGLISVGIYNFTRNIDSVKFLIDNPNSYKDVAQFHQLNPIMPQMGVSNGNDFVKTVYVDRIVENSAMRIIGIRNLTDSAGSTTLTYMLKKTLEQHYSAKAIEVDKHDFLYFNDKTLISASGVELPAVIAKNSDVDVLLIDLNSMEYEEQCSDIIYLIEPGIIKLNKLIRRDRNIFEKAKDKKIVLNKSTLSSKDVTDFEFESQSHIHFNIPFLDDRKDNHKVLEDFLLSIGFSRFNGSADNKSGLFGIFK